ncbi:MAG: type II toxin-antitoxin system death-on-curing family toxin [Phycisphaerales bacterium]
MTVQPIAKEPRFITLEEALSLHESAIDAHGGSYGIRDQGLLESALAAPRQGFGGQYAYAFPHEMAAAYLFHLCKNHAFIDGNKRIAWVSAVFFMRVNGWSVLADEQEAIQVVLRVATDEMDKPAVASWLVRVARPRCSLELRTFFFALTFEEILRKRQELMAGSNDEFNASLDDAIKALPFLREWSKTIQSAHDRNDSGAVKTYANDLGLFLTLYRIAEDMGYEW